MKLVDAFKIIETQYRQCRLRRGNVEQVAWIPQVFAKRGKHIRIRDQNGWQVISLGGILSGDYLTTYVRDAYRTQRAASDI